MNRFILLGMTALFFLSGCRQDGGKESELIQGTADTAGGQIVQFNPQKDKYDPPAVMTVAAAVNPEMTFKNGETLENNVHTRWAKERLGIDIRYLWTIPNQNHSFDTKLRLELAAGRPLPDVLPVRGEVVHELIDSGQFMEVGELFERYASRSWKEAMDTDPSVWHPYMRNGKKYAIPILDYEYSSDPVLWIREDWLKRLNLKAPETMDELTEVMKAFSTGDPDGNHLKDTYGLAVGFKNGMNSWMADADWIFGGFGSVPGQWNAGDGGRLEYGSVDPGAETALALLQRWMKEGYISREAEWFDELRAAQQFASGEAGIVAGPIWMKYWPLGDMLSRNKDAVIAAYKIPSGPDGKVARRGSLLNNGAVLINKDMKHPELFFTYQNYLFDHYAQQSGEFKYGLAEGYDWVRTPEGQESSKPSDIPGGYVRVAAYTLTFDGARIPEAWNRNVVPEDVPVHKVLLSQADASKQDMFRGAPTETMGLKGELLKKLEKETFIQIIYSRLPAAAFREFTRSWRGLGGEQITEEVNQWYDEVK
ncbi:extracellular solute-binding protein [Paenibacillus sp. S-38]|uniref:extracellular solute-binding protein n=1 Tax=Paenibacillus sp. S-38 TaxID=3416710 RepID=UPI003CF6489A